MVWCKYCVRDCQVDRDHASGYICCTQCGRVLYQDVFTDEPTFTKGAAGESRMNGVFVRSIQNEYSESFKRTLEKGRRHIEDLMIKLEIPDESLGVQASSFYRIAVERSFTRGRRTEQVAAACLYIACRSKNKPYLLIDFAIWLGVNVYVLGAVYLQLCKLLSLEEHEFVQKSVDPSLFMHRFTSALMKGDYKSKVWKTALQIVASMKRDWMQTGRKPSGICGAALYISALSHGFSYSKSEIVKIVYICEATLTKRLVEFENTTSGSLTIEEFTQNAEEFERENRSIKQPDVNANEADKMEVLCEHKGKEPHFAHGLCKSCYKDFLELSGGLDGGSEPPAFQVAEMSRVARASAEKERCSDEVNDNMCNTKKDAVPGAESASVSGNLDTERYDTIFEDGDIPSISDETDNLSDIDDLEVNCYLNSEEESRLKKTIWDATNKEYLQEQAAKEAAASAAMKDLGEASDDVRKFAAAVAASVAKSKEERKQQRASEAKNAAPPQTAAEATRRILIKKGFSSKINYDVLEKLFDETLPSSAKKSRALSLDDEDDGAARKQAKKEEKEAKPSNSDEQEEENEGDMEDDVAEEVDGDQIYDQNENYYDEENNDFFDDY